MSSIIPAWILQCLEQYGNCACGRTIVKKMGKESLLKALADAGYPCELEILSDQKDKSQFPKDGTYIVSVKNHSAGEDEKKDTH